MTAKHLPFREFLTPNQRPYLLAADEDANLVGMRWYGEGPFHREYKLAINIQKKSHFVIRSGDVIYNKLFAWKGAFGIVPQELDGMFVSDKFPTYSLNVEKVDPGYLRWHFRTPGVWEQAKAISTGSAAISKLTLNPPQFLDLTAPVPPVSEQRRIVAKIEKLASKIKEARGLQRQLLDVDFEVLRNTCFRAALQGTIVARPSGDPTSGALVEQAGRLKADLETSGRIKKQKRHPPITVDELPFDAPKSWVWARLEEITSVITDGTHWTPQYLEEGRIFLSAQNVKPYRFMPESHKYVSDELFQACMARGKPEKGDILMTRVGAMIGETALIDRDVEFAYYVSLCLIKPLRQVVHVPYLVHWLNSPFGTASTRQYTLGRGHSQGNLNLNLTLIRKFVIPMPSLEEQRRIVAYLDDLQAKVDQRKKLQAQTAAELDALLPSILDRAFRGEL